VPLIKRRVTGQIGGNVGAYGNVGSIVFLTVYSLLPEGDVGDRLFFQMQGIAALIVTFLCAFLLKEPQDLHEEDALEVITPGVAVSKRQI
jgi:NNP family nitrate/nitrite transporter-like MFS transporter